MNASWKKWVGAAGVAGVAGLWLCMCGPAAAQSTGGSQGSQSGQNPPPATQPTDKDKLPAANTLSLDLPAPPVNAEEDAAFKEFQDCPMTDFAKKIQLGEALAQKFGQSRYLPVVYSTLTVAYMQSGDVPKMIETGEKELALNPNDVQVLAILGQTMTRVYSAGAPDALKRLDKAEQYSKRAIEVTPTLQKPPNVTEESFAAAKNQALAMAHGGLGLVYFRRGKFGDAIPELEQSVKVDPTPDPVNYYLLGLANEKTSHFDDAIGAFTKCAASANPMQNTCKNQMEEAKKLAATQLSAPK